MFDDMEAAKTLGIGTGELAKQMVSGVGKKGYGSLNNGIFTPLSISKNVIRGFIENARELGVKSPIFDALGTIAQIRAQLFRINLDEAEGFPSITNPLATPIIPDLVGALNNQLPPLPDPTLNTGTQFGNVNTNVNAADQYAALFPGDETGKLIKQRQTTNQNVMRRT